jgi:peptidoglycan/LPS O-acetylase OafA/YrhL
VILLIVIILVAAVVTGSLGGVLQVAAGVAVGIFLAVIGLALAGYYVLRHKVRRLGRDMERYRRERYGEPPSGHPGRNPRGQLPPDAGTYE